MISDELYKALLEFFETVDIRQGEETATSVIMEDLNEQMVSEKLKLISEFHKRAMGYKGYMGLRLDNKTGSTVEQFKVSIKRLKRYLKNIRINSASSNFERKLLKVGFDYVQRAENCISEIMASGYMDIIGRSMKRTEICLGNTSFQELNELGGTIFVSSLKKCSYNNVEMDCYYFLYKCRKKELKLDYKKLVEEYCEYEELGENSVRFILTLLSYPCEFMRCCNRYRERIKDWSEEEYEERLDKAILRDGEVLI